MFALHSVTPRFREAVEKAEKAFRLADTKVISSLLPYDEAEAYAYAEAITFYLVASPVFIPPDAGFYFTGVFPQNSLRDVQQGV